MRKPYDANKMHPKAREVFGLLTHRLEQGFTGGFTTSWFRPFEGYRAPEDQTALVRRGVSKAGPWQSAHNYGLAVDFVAWDADKQAWSWAEEEDWKFLKEAAIGCGLVHPISWDRPHVEHPIWRAISRQLV